VMLVVFLGLSWILSKKLERAVERSWRDGHGENAPSNAHGPDQPQTGL